MFAAEAFYLVLFDFTDFNTPLDVNARIWQVDPKSPGFALCVIDYFFNIRSKSKSKAPFNLWPFSLKFDLMKPSLIFHAVIDGNDQITTTTFPGRDAPVPWPVQPLTTNYVRSPTMSVRSIRTTRRTYEMPSPSKAGKKKLLESAEAMREDEGWDDADLADVLASAIYLPLLSPRAKTLVPTSTRSRLW